MVTKRRHPSDRDRRIPASRANERTLTQFRREVVALLRAGHRIPNTVGAKLVTHYQKFVKDSWSVRKAPCWVSDNIARKYSELRTSRDPDNPQPFEVYESKAGARWQVTSVNAERRRIKVKKAGFRDLGELEWNPSVLRKMKQLGIDAGAKMRSESEAAPVRPQVMRTAEEQAQASWFRRTFGGGTEGDPDRQYRVYIIESLHEGERVFYVGQSAHSPAQRLAQHRKGVRYCNGCTKRSYAKGAKMRLRQDLLGSLTKRSFKTRTEAERTEKMVARMLRAQGLTVEGGH